MSLTREQELHSLQTESQRLLDFGFCLDYETIKETRDGIAKRRKELNWDGKWIE